MRPRILLYSKWVFLFAAMTLVASVGWAQNPKVEKKWWVDKSIRSRLKWTDQQVKQLEKNMAEFRDRLDWLRNEMNAKLKKHEDLLASGNKDPKAMTELVKEYYTLRAELDNILMTLSIRQGQVLTDAQKDLLRKLQS